MLQNADLNDWCCPEPLAAEGGDTRADCHDAAVVNHVVPGTVFDRLPCCIRRPHKTDERVARGNRQIAAEGLPGARWNCVSPEGEARCQLRACSIVLPLDTEAMRPAIARAAEALVAGPIPAGATCKVLPAAARRGIGCRGEGHCVGDISLAVPIGNQALSQTLRAGTDLFLGGIHLDSTGDVGPHDLAASSNPRRVCRITSVVDSDPMSIANRPLCRPDGTALPVVGCAVFRPVGQPRSLSHRRVLKGNGRPRRALRERLRDRDSSS